MREANDRDQGPVATSTHPPAARPARSTYRQLVSRGLDPSEAANVTAFVHGLAVGVQPWKINELSHLLFLRELYRVGTFGENDGAERRRSKEHLPARIDDGRGTSGFGKAFESTDSVVHGV